MKKSERIELAKKCFAKIKELELEVKIDGNWILLSPPSKIPVELTMDVANCSEHLIKLFENVSPQ
ncbi:MAG: hypothetical protein KF816_11380 [Melioribacteraceae bacterium]|nr:hypothetical protein [Melioribacteraceae bacterium]